MATLVRGHVIALRIRRLLSSPNLRGQISRGISCSGKDGDIKDKYIPEHGPPTEKSKFKPITSPEEYIPCFLYPAEPEIVQLENGTTVPVRELNPRKVKCLNRNPMDQPRMAGYKLNIDRDWFCRITVDLSNRYMTSNLIYHTGHLLATASTKEFPIVKNCPDTLDPAAVRNLGLVMADRCLRVGMNRIFPDLPRNPVKLLNIFRAALKEKGVICSELPRRPEMIRPAVIPAPGPQPSIKEDYLRLVYSEDLSSISSFYLNATRTNI